MSHAPPGGCSPDAIARIDQALAARNWRVLRRIETPDRVIDWLAVAPDGVYWLLRAIWPPPGHPIGVAEVQGLLEALELVPEWSGWLVTDREVAPEAAVLGAGRLCISNIEAIFPHERD